MGMKTGLPTHTMMPAPCEATPPSPKKEKVAQNMASGQPTHTDTPAPLYEKPPCLLMMRGRSRVGLVVVVMVVRRQQP